MGIHTFMSCLVYYTTNVVLSVFLVSSFFVYKLTAINPCNSFTQGHGTAFITHQIEGHLTNRNKFRKEKLHSNSNELSKAINNNSIKLSDTKSYGEFANNADYMLLDSAILDKYGFKIVGDIELKEERSVKRLLHDVYNSEQLSTIKSKLLTTLNTNLSMCNMNDMVADINEKIANKQNIDLTNCYSRCIICLANKFETSKLVELFQHMINFHELLDIFHFSLVIRYLAQVGYDNLDVWIKLFDVFNNVSLKTCKYGLFVTTDDVKPFVVDKKTYVGQDIDINSLSLFGLNHSYIFDREQMGTGILESFVLGLVQNIHGYQESIGMEEYNNEQGYKSLCSNSKLINIIMQLNIASAVGKIELSWITKVILRHINRILPIDNEFNTIDTNTNNYEGRLFMNLEDESNGVKQSKTIEESCISAIDKFINSPLSSITKQNKLIQPPLLLPKFIYPSTHTQIFNELMNSTSYITVFDIAKLLFSDATNVEELAITDIYYIIRHMLKFKKATSVIESLLKFDVLHSNRLMEHIKCCTYECEMERDPIEALKVLNFFKQTGISPSKGLIDDLANKLNND